MRIENAQENKWTFGGGFRRTISSGRYMPEVDGLRFIAIFLVVVMLHFGNFMRECQLKTTYDPGNFFHRLMMEGWYGVPVFFAISGFILSLPFARSKILGEEAVPASKYYLRRLARIEPPYLVAMAVYFVLKVWVLHSSSFSDLFPHFLATISYSHNIIYGYPSEIMGIAWSLEVEAQFYILAPLITHIFFVKNTVIRRTILVSLIAAGAIHSYYWSQVSGMYTLINQGCYFFVGILLADIYLLTKNKSNKSPGMAAIAVALFLVFLCIPAYAVNVYVCVLKAFLLLVILYLFITNGYTKKWLSNTLIATIGGMCYSIYLVHMGIFGVLRHSFFYRHFTGSAAIDIGLHAVIALLLVLMCSGIFFLLVEKPTMRSGWYLKFAGSARQRRAGRLAGFGE